MALKTSHEVNASRSYFALGKFQVNPYTIRVNFDVLRGFYARLSNRNEVIQNVEVVAPFAQMKHISREQLGMLSDHLARDYSVRLVGTKNDGFRVEFTPKLSGGGNIFSRSKSTPPPLGKGESKLGKGESKGDLLEDEKEDMFSKLPERNRMGTVVDVPTDIDQIKTTLQLALSIQQTLPSNPNYDVLVKRALNVIEAYSKREINYTSEILKEAITLVRTGHPLICKAVIKTIFEKCQKSVFLEPNLLQALSDAIRFTNPRFLDQDDLVAILKFVVSKKDAIHEQEKTLQKLYVVLHVTANILQVMGDANVEKLSYDATHDPLYKLLDKLSNHEDWRISTQAAYAKESLLRINHDKSKFMLFFDGLMNFSAGVGNVVVATTYYSPAALLSAYGNFKKAIHMQSKPESWYNHIRFFMLMLEQSYKEEELFKLFDDELNDSFKTLPENEFFLLLRALTEALLETSAKHKMPRNKLSALALLEKIYSDDKKWGDLSPKMGGLKNDKEKAVTPVKVTILRQIKSVAVSSDDENLRAKAKEALGRIQKAAENDFQKGWLKAAKIPADLSKLKLRPHAPSHADRYSTPGMELLEDVNKQQPVLSSLVSEMKRKYDEDKTEIQELLKTYIAPSGSTDSAFQDPFPLEPEIMKFLNDKDRKVLLLSGGAGSGKTTFGKYLTYILWKDVKADQGRIPIFVPLGALSNPVTGAIDETLGGYGFTDAQIKQLKREHSFVFIFDGYDEMIKHPNLYVENNLDQWKDSKVIISCRTNFSKITDSDKPRLFMPYSNGFPESRKFKELWVTPFSEKQIDDYLKKYLAANESEWTFAQYKENILQIQGLNALISTPFLLYLTAEVLPGIVEKHKDSRKRLDEKLEILRRDLYDSFMETWFIRAEGKLMQAHKLADYRGRDIKVRMEEYCKDLAAQMFASENVTYVEYVPPADDEAKEGPWDKYFGNKYPIPLLRDGAPLRRIAKDEYSSTEVDPKTGKRPKVQKQVWAFFHKTLQEYFVSRDVLDVMTKGDK